MYRIDRFCGPYMESSHTVITSCLLNEHSVPDTNEMQLNRSVVKQQVTYRLELKIWFVFNSKFFLTCISETRCAFIIEGILQHGESCPVACAIIFFSCMRERRFFFPRCWPLGIGASTDQVTSCCSRAVIIQPHFKRFNWLLMPSLYTYQILFIKINCENEHKCGWCHW